MFIIPIQNKPDWSRPPLATIALILINLLVFLFYQGQDDDKEQLAIETYQRLELASIERPHYKQYLQQEQPEFYRRWQAAEQADADMPPLAQLVVQDLAFDQYLRQHWWSAAQSADELAEWQDKRETFEAQRNKISALQAGLIPANPEPLDFITSLFLHGGWGHLLGNMAFLFLFGFILESALRPAAYLGMYLVSGLAADGLFMVFNPNSTVPIVGASGAISGLMGMYLALYGLRRIRFFYSLLFYFGEFRAPALWVFPAWLAKELYGTFFVDSNIAYWAHIGGLLAGLAMVLAMPGNRKEFAQQEEKAEQDDLLEQKLQGVQRLVANLDVEPARQRAERLCQQHPKDPRPWQTLFELYKPQPSNKAFHKAAFRALRAFCQHGDDSPAWSAMAKTLLDDYQNLAPRAPALTGDLALMLGRRFWALDERSRAERCIRLATERGAKTQPLIKTLNRVHEYYRARSDKKRAGEWQAVLNNVNEQT